MNAQPISKADYNSSGVLELHHTFYTIQGEGPFAGSPSVFVRLAGCNLQCPYCDTDYTSANIKVSPAFILEEVRQTPLRRGGLVVISGGEPMRQNIGPLINMLLKAGYQVQVETNGTLFAPDLPYGLFTIVCSPKAGSINKNLLPYIDALKYVVHADQIDKTDGLPIKALGHRARPTTAKPPKDFTGTVFVQPIDVDDALENARHLDAAIRSCMDHGYRLCVQVHKIINVE